MIQRVYLTLRGGEPYGMVELDHFADGHLGLAVHLLEDRDGTIETTGRIGVVLDQEAARQFRSLVAE